MRSKKKKDKFLFNNIVLIKVSISVFFVTLFLILFFLGGGALYFKNVNYSSTFRNYDFQVHAINVGHGDAILIKLPGNVTMLIDTGSANEYKTLNAYINQYLKCENLNKIDYLVLSHSDEDHVGSAEYVLNDFSISTVYRPKIYTEYELTLVSHKENYLISESECFDNAIKKAYEKDCNIVFSERGLNFDSYGFNIEFLSPSKNNYSQSNDYSAVIMITFQDKKFLFMGDAEENIEKELLAYYGEDLKADVLKIGHHGSNTSSTELFIKTVNPSYGILSVGNGYNLPNSEVINRLKENNVKVLSTNELGSFELSVENNNIVFAAEDRPAYDIALLISIFIILILMVWVININWFLKQEGK